MARIPVYEERQSVSQQLRVSGLRIPDTGARFIAQGMQDVSRALNVAANVAVNVQEENAKVWASNTSSDALLKWTQTVKERQETAAPGAVDFTKSILGDFDKWSDNALKEAPADPVSKNLLASNLRQLRQNIFNTAVTFEATEGRNHRFTQMSDSILKSGQAIALQPNEVNLAQVMGERMAEIDSLRDTPTKKNQLRENLRLTLGRSGAEAMAREQPAVLLAQIDAAKKRGAKTSSGNAYLDLLPATEWDSYIKIAQSNTDALNVESTANTVWNTMGPRDDTQPVNKDLMYAQIDRDMSDRTAAERRAAKAIIDSRSAAFDYSSRQRQAATQAGVWNQVLQGKTLDQIQQSREFKILDGTTKMQLLSQIDTMRKAKADDVGQLAHYLTLTEDPAKLAGMSDAEIVAAAPKLGDTLTKDLLKRRQSLNDPNNVQAASIDEDTFKALAQEAGLDPYKPKKSENEAAALGRLKYTIEQKIDIEQQAKKRKLTPQEKETIFKQEIDNKVFIDRTLRTDPEMPIALVETDRLGDTYVVVNGQEIKLNTIPANSRNMIIRQLRAAGRPVTERAIAEVYVLSRSLPSSAVEQIPR